MHAFVRWNVIFLFSRQHNRQRRRTLTGCWWWGSFCWPSAWASPVSSWLSSSSSLQNRKIFRCYGSSSHKFSIVYFFIMSVICFWIIFYAQPLHCIRYQRKLKAATAMVYGEYEISETYQDLSFFCWSNTIKTDASPMVLTGDYMFFRARKWYAEDPGSRDQSTCLWKVSEPMMIDSFKFMLNLLEKVTKVSMHVAMLLRL